MRKKRTLTPEQIAQYNQIPAAMRERPQWVCYTLEPGKDGAITKIPREPKTGARAKINDPSGWVTFDEALARVERYDGLEYMLIKDDPFTFVDLDHCIDINTGEISAEAQRIINRFDSYTEESQSGTGIHIIGIGSKPGKRCRINSYPNIEMYDDARAVVMTGKVIQNHITIEKCGNEINGLYFDLFGDAGTESQQYQQSPPSSALSSNATSTHVISDAELIEKACSSPKNGASFCHLWNGNLSEYNGDWSAADQALCNHLAWWTNRDFDRIDHLFRMSGLMRDKWEKREDYRRRTINKAIRDTSGGYTGKSQSQSQSKPNRNGRKPNARNNQNKNNEPQISDSLHLTDLGNAERLIAHHGDNIRFNCDAGRWIVWDGHRWLDDRTGQVERFAKQTIRAEYGTLGAIQDSATRDALYKHLKSSESKNRIEAMLRLAQTEMNIPITSDDLDTDPWLFNCANGVIDLRTGKMRAHNPTDMLTKMAAIEYDSRAKCPHWEQFLSDIFQQNKEIIDFVRRAMGYSLTADTKEQVFFLLFGSGSNGKSTFINVMRDIMGDYGMQVDTSTILERNSGGIPNDIARLRGARMTSAIETKATAKMAEDLVKQITGNDKLVARFLRQEFFEFEPVFKLWLACNHKPRIDGQEHGIWRRIRLIPFNVRFQDSDSPEGPYKDKTLPAKLRAEYPGILAWAVRGCLEWQAEGLGHPAAIRSATDDYRHEMDILGGFLAECCVCAPQATTSAKDLYNAYLTWCEENKERPLSQRNFGIKLGERGTFERYMSTGRCYWRNIGLVYFDTSNNRSDQVDQVDQVDRETGINGHVNPRMSNKPDSRSTSSTSSTSSIFDGLDEDFDSENEVEI